MSKYEFSTAKDVLPEIDLIEKLLQFKDLNIRH